MGKIVVMGSLNFLFFIFLNTVKLECLETSGFGV
jgi:hypothetical protein